MRSNLIWTISFVSVLVLVSGKIITALAGCSGSDSSNLSELTVRNTVSSDSGNSSENANSDWPNLFGPSYDSTSRENRFVTTWESGGPKEKWSCVIGEGYSAPIVVGGKLITLSRKENQEVVRCQNAKNGKSIWEYRYPTSFSCEFEYSNGPYSTPAANRQYVVTVGAEGQICCFDHQTGSIIWQRKLLDDYQVENKQWPVTSSPLIWNDRVILNLGAASQKAGVIAINLQDGKTIWEATDHGPSFASPVPSRLHGKDHVFAMTDQGLVVLDANNGNVFWEVPHRTRRALWNNAVSPIVHGDRVTIVTGPSVKPGLRSFKIQQNGTYVEPWSNIRLLNTQYTNVVVVDGYLFGFTPMKQGGPELRCIDLRSGKMKWKHQPNVGRGNLLAVGNSLLILGEDGHLVSMELNASRPIEKSRTENPILEKPCYTSMALSNGLIFARNERRLICIDLNKQEKRHEQQ